jgi:hypothetical protein
MESRPFVSSISSILNKHAKFRLFLIVFQSMQNSTVSPAFDVLAAAAVIECDVLERRRLLCDSSPTFSLNESGVDIEPFLRPSASLLDVSLMLLEKQEWCNKAQIFVSF